MYFHYKKVTNLRELNSVCVCAHMCVRVDVSSPVLSDYMRPITLFLAFSFIFLHCSFCTLFIQRVIHCFLLEYTSHQIFIGIRHPILCIEFGWVM